MSAVTKPRDAILSTSAFVNRARIGGEAAINRSTGSCGSMHSLMSSLLPMPRHAVRVEGSIAGAARQAAIDRFQKERRCRLALLSITAAGVKNMCCGGSLTCRKALALLFGSASRSVSHAYPWVLHAIMQRPGWSKLGYIAEAWHAAVWQCSASVPLCQLGLFH